MPENTTQVSGPTPQEQILAITNNYWQGCSVGAAAQLELADLLADGPLHVDALAERTQTHAPSLFRMLRALESTGIFTQVSPGVFANTPASECLRRHLPGSQWAWIRITLSADGLGFDGWRALMQALQNGRPGFDQLRGYPVWEYLQTDPQQGTIFNQAMRDFSASMTPAVTASYDWSQFPVIADIGGGIGTQLLSILDANPSCRGILFDQAQAVAEAPQHSRMERIGGDFFDDIPISADAYLMRWVIHDWNDDKAIEILKNVRKAATLDARLLLVEWVIRETAEFDLGKWMDVNMLVMAGGHERTGEEFRDLYHRAGFELERIVLTSSPLSIIIGKPQEIVTERQEWTSTPYGWSPTALGHGGS
jgi:hypothetical protein